MTRMKLGGDGAGIMDLRNRVIEYRVAPAREFMDHAGNWRLHPQAQRDGLRGLLGEVGMVGALTAYYSERQEGLTLVDGHLRKDDYPDTEWPVLFLDIDDAEADLVLATLDPLGAMAEADSRKLEEALGRVLSEDDAVVAMLRGLAEKENVAFREREPAGKDPGAQVDRATELQEKWRVERGDVWEVGVHRVMCGDCTVRGDVERLMGGERVILLHADPPYGMGKEKDGIVNDNLYREKLDAFQMQWWHACRAHLEDNGSAYIWGNAENLWRLWYTGGLKDSERLTLRNEIVWDKAHGQGMESEKHRMFPSASERCLFFMLGEQGFNNNADNYWDGWEPIRLYLDGERMKAGWSKPKVEKILGSVNKTQHIFSNSHFNLITKTDYQKLQHAAQGDAFKRDYDDLKRDYDDLKRDYDDLKRDFYATRAYFDNTHDNMTDVWQFSRVQGADRWEHATPKPVELTERIVRSSSEKDNVVLDPFLGSGTTLVACEKTGRVGRGMEIEPRYVAVTLERLTGMGLEARRVEQDD